MKVSTTLTIIFCSQLLIAQIHYQTNLGEGKAIEVFEKPGAGFWLLAEIDSNFWNIELDEFGDEENRFLISEASGKITFSKDENIYIAHETGDSLNRNILVQKVDYQGNMIWSETYDYYLNEHSPEIFPTKDSGIVVSNLIDTIQTVWLGQTFADVPYTYAEIVKFDKEGTKNWHFVKSIGSSFTNNFIIERENGNFVFFSEHIAAPPFSNLYIHDYTFELDPQGNQLDSDSYYFGTVGIGGLESLDLVPTKDGEFVKVRKYNSWTTHGSGQFLSVAKVGDVDNSSSGFGFYNGDSHFQGGAGGCAHTDFGFLDHFKIIPTNEGGFLHFGRISHSVMSWCINGDTTLYQHSWSIRKIRNEGDLEWQAHFQWNVLNGIEMQNGNFALCGEFAGEIIFAIMDKNGLPVDIQVECFVQNQTPTVGDTIELICVVHNQSPNKASRAKVEIEKGVGLQLLETVETYPEFGDFQPFESKNITQKYLVTSPHQTYFYTHLTKLLQIDTDSEAGSSECCDDYEDDEFLLPIFPQQMENLVEGVKLDFVEDSGFKIFPNPFSDNFQIEISSSSNISAQEINISIYNILGQKMNSQFSEKQFENEKFIKNIDTNHWQPGTYFLILKIGEYEMVKRIIKI